MNSNVDYLLPQLANDCIITFITITFIPLILLKSHRFLLRFTGKEEEVNLAGDGSERPEFAEWSWMTPQQVIDLVSDVLSFKQKGEGVGF